MKLYYSPNACSMAIHIILEEIGAPYELALVNFAERAQYQPDYLAINPKSKVPALLLDDGSILTELPAISWYLARSHPQAGLLPSDIKAEAQVLELLEYITATIHMRGFTRIFRPGSFAPRPEDEASVIEAGREMVTQGLAVLEPVLGTKDYLLGAHSIADCAAFYIIYWAARRTKIALSPTFDAYLERLLARPAVQRMLVAEGLA